MYDAETTTVGFGTGCPTCADSGEMWFWRPEGAEDGRRRGLRVWWDGSDPDAVIGDGDGVADEMGQLAAFHDPSWSQSKGQSSYRFEFRAHGAEYLPWARSRFNESPDFPGRYEGVFQDAARLIVERGVWDGREWSWIQEGQVFIVKSPAAAEEGCASMDVTAMGAISPLVTRATYEGLHKPNEIEYTDVELALEEQEDGGWLCRREADGGYITDWVLKPAPVVKVAGAEVSDYTLDTSAGTIAFEDEPDGTVTATFFAYEPGTNEAEDIIKCILTYPQELGGCGLDESYITRGLEGAELATDDFLTYAFPKNNLVPSDPSNRVYRDGVQVAGGFEWNERDGAAVFSSSQEGRAITGDAAYYTIQKSGVTLRPITFHPRVQKNSHDAIQEVCRRVAPNYVLREGRDGKLECDFFTQKISGEEDIVIEDGDIVITSLNSNPAYEGLATRVLSFGRAELEELPNYALGKDVRNRWTEETGYHWHHESGLALIVDGDPATGATGGYGRWKEGTLAVQKLLIAAGAAGVPWVSVDLGELRDVDEIIIARPSQAATEGDAGAVQIMSVWVSEDGAEFKKIVSAFELGPGQNTKLKAGTAYDENTRFQFIQINLHSLGLYKWEGHTASQMGISEIQCYPNEVITGEARLQDEDPEAPLYDRWGLLDKYGIATHVARGGSVDDMLNTQAKADEDARLTLEEIVRLAGGAGVRSPWLPGVPVFSTVRVVNSALGIDTSFFIEEHSAGADGDTYSGNELP
jgi:hypothetical protein